MEFREMSISSKTISALNEMHFYNATEVQEKTLPLILAGKEVVVRSQTGTGKTAVFGIAMVEAIAKDRNVKGLVLSPTRELAMQITKELRLIGKNHDLKIFSIYGGQGMREQIDVLRKNYDIIVATPGRLLDHARRGTIRLEKFNYVVLDEADNMLDIGFKPDIDKIMAGIPRKNQVLLFSATINEDIKSIARNYMRNPETIEVGQKGKVEKIEEEFINIKRADKIKKLVEILSQDDVTKAIVFVASKRGVEYVTQKINDKGIPAQYTHGGKTQNQRERIMRDFKQGKFRILVATDVMARGIHVEGISHIINYDKANTLEIHTHRIGRTGRMGSEGKAITFIETDAPAQPSRRPAFRRGGGGFGHGRVRSFNFHRRFR